MLSEIETKEIARELLHRGTKTPGFQKFIYKGRSMNPILSAEDEILVKSITPRDLCLGDIIVYKDTDRFIIHRFLYCKVGEGGEPYIIAKADNSSEKDKPIKQKYLIGKAIEIDKKKRRINLESSFWRITSYLIGIVSFLETASFKTIGTLKRIFLKKLKVGNVLKARIALLIRVPKFALSKMLISITK